MFTQSNKILCVDPSNLQRALIKQVADECALDVVMCSTEDEGLEHLLSQEQFALMITAHELAAGDSLHLLEYLRTLLDRAKLPAAFVMADRDLVLAQNAIRAGASEIFLRSDPEALFDFIRESATTRERNQLSGRVLLVEDSPSHAAYVGHLCNQLGLTVDRAIDVDSALDQYRRQKYLLVITDVVLNDSRTGNSLVRSIRQNHKERQPILVMSSFDDVPRRLMALTSGADDFISKPFAPQEFVWRLKKVLHIYPDDTAQLDSSVLNKQKHSDEHYLANLSPREHEVLTRLIAGSDDQAIANALGISYWTVRGHIQHIFAKTGAINRRELIVRYLNKLS